MGAAARSFGFFLPALLLTQAAAQVQFTNSDFDDITAGEPFDITFAGDGSVSRHDPHPHAPTPQPERKSADVFPTHSL